MSEAHITHEEIISLCRLCLAKDLASVDIFETGNEIRFLFTKILACLPVQVASNDNLPHKICEVCNSKVDDFYNFWSSTARNQKQLNDWLRIATNESKKTDQPTIKVEADDTRQTDDFDYDDTGRGDSYDEDDDEPLPAKRIKTQDCHSDVEPKIEPGLSSKEGEEDELNGEKEGARSSKEQSKEQLTNLDVPLKRTCRICKQVLENFSAFRKHLRVSHPGEKDFPCRLCDSSFAYKYLKYKHASTVHRGLPTRPTFMCEPCNKSFANRDLYEDHVSLHHQGIKRHLCNVCPAAFATYNQLTGHKVTHLPVKKSYQCQKCGIVFRARSSYNLHKSKVHENKSWQCPLCGKVMAAYDRNHLRIHEKERKYVCETCGKRFNCPKYLKDHRMSHDAIKPFKCDFCEKRFTQRTPRSIHIRKFHTHVHPYECDMCSERFATKDELKKHIINHWKCPE